MIKKLLFALFVLVALACGGGGGGGTAPGGGANGVTLNVYTANLSFGQTLHLTATVPGVSVQTVTWTVTGGSITPISATDAVYTAPGSAGTYSITATSVAEPSKTATCVVTVSQVGITLDPGATTVNPGTVVGFTATITGTGNLNANFSASAGTITKTGPNTANYTAPGTNGTYTVTATAAADSSKKATSTVTVANVGSSATVNGIILQDSSAVGVAGVVVAFYNSGGAELARSTTGVDGRFSASVPTTAKRFHIIGSSLGTSYYLQFTYGALRYSILISGCTAPLPTLTSGGTVTLTQPIELTPSSLPPPPPPSGC